MLKSLSIPFFILISKEIKPQSKFLYSILRQQLSFFDETKRLVAIVDTHNSDIEEIKKLLNLNDRKYQLVLQDLYMSPFVKITDDFKYCYFLVSPDMDS